MIEKSSIQTVKLFWQVFSEFVKILTRLIQNILKQNESHNRSQYLYLNLAEGKFLVGLVFYYIRQKFWNLELNTVKIILAAILTYLYQEKANVATF